VRIAFVTDTYLPEVNGVTTVLRMIRQSLAARGHEVLFLAPAYPDPTAEDDRVIRRPSMPCPRYPAVRLSSPFGPDVFRALDRFEPELVHVVTEGPLGAIGRRYALRRGRPLVTSFHTDFPRYAARYLGSWAQRVARRYLRRFHAPAVLTQTPSAASRAELVALGLAHAVVWGRGVESDRFTPVRRSAARRADLGAADRVIVLHVGRLAVEKDPEVLVEAFSRAQEAVGPQALFCVAGDGPRGPGLRRALPFARHFGFLARDVLADLYADADLFVFPSPTETCGLVTLEAMASALPVISADHGGVLENMRDGINGMVVATGDGRQFADAIVTLIRDTRQRAAMGQAARAFAVGRDWSREMSELERMYAEAVGCWSSAAPPVDERQHSEIEPFRTSQQPTSNSLQQGVDSCPPRPALP
jgi:glycosyltransferase involved in cell wall biosynthesis